MERILDLELLKIKDSIEDYTYYKSTIFDLTGPDEKIFIGPVCI